MHTLTPLQHSILLSALSPSLRLCLYLSHSLFPSIVQVIFLIGNKADLEGQVGPGKLLYKCFTVIRCPITLIKTMDGM